jgi:hypothetical protein
MDAGSQPKLVTMSREPLPRTSPTSKWPYAAVANAAAKQLKCWAKPKPAREHENNLSNEPEHYSYASLGTAHHQTILDSGSTGHYIATNVPLQEQATIHVAHHRRTSDHSTISST